MTEAKSRLPLYLLAMALRAICKRHHVSLSCTKCLQAARTIHGKQLQASIKFANSLVPKAKFAALRGIPLVQDERELPAHAAGAHS